MRRLEPAQVDLLVRLVLGDDARGDVVARLVDRTGGDVRLLLARLLVMVQEGHPIEPDAGGYSNGAGHHRPHVVLRLEGDHWAVTFAGQTVHLRDTRGLRYLAALIDRPGEPLHVLDLVRRGGREVRRGADPDRARQTVTKCIGLALEKSERCHPGLAAHLRASVRRGLRCAYLPVQDT